MTSSLSEHCVETYYRNELSQGKSEKAVLKSLVSERAVLRLARKIAMDNNDQRLRGIADTVQKSLDDSSKEITPRQREALATALLAQFGCTSAVIKHAWH